MGKFKRIKNRKSIASGLGCYIAILNHYPDSNSPFISVIIVGALGPVVALFALGVGTGALPLHTYKSFRIAIVPEFILMWSGEFGRSIYFPAPRKKHKPPTTKYNQKSKI